MPIIQNTRKINPLDINNNVRIGVSFPLNEVNMTSGTLTTKEQIKTNLINLLLTVPGERINNPNYGIGLKNLVFESSVDENTLLENINTQTSFFMPEISVESAKIERELDLYRLSISITYSINNEKNDDSIQINFR
jgi:phage baseplate assembly protein W